MLALSITFFEVGFIAWILTMFGLIALGDLVMAWENGRAIASGRVKLWNEIVGETVVVTQAFTHESGKYHGFVRLGAERWAAESSVALSEGARARIIGKEGLSLRVMPSV